MSRKAFLTLYSAVALGVGTLAAIAPAALLESKGVLPNQATQVWVREVGFLLIPLGLMAFLVRSHRSSPTLKAFLFGNLLIHMGFLPIEAIAYSEGIITKLSGVIPNTVLHALFVGGLAYYWIKADRTQTSP